LRDDLVGVFDPRVFTPNLLAALAIAVLVFAAFAQGFSSAAVIKRAAPVLTLALLLATGRIFIPGGERTLYATPEIFWNESLRCFLKGLVATGAVATWLAVFAYSLSPLPARRWRTLLAAASGVSGAAMLGFHCDSSSSAHVVLGHVAQGLVAGTVFYAIQEILFRRRLKNSLPGAMSWISNPGRIG
jgi:hypothetical protein